MSNSPLVSLGLPVYNGERFLAQLLDSVLLQTHENFELIISDNASTDGTVEICEDYAKRDARIAVHRSITNRGSAWNHGRVRDLATGAYFKWLGADDVMDPRFLEMTLTAVLSQPDVVNAYPMTIVIDDSGTELLRSGAALPIDSPDIAVRFGTLIQIQPATNCMFYGLFRRSLMDRARPMGAFLAADRCMLAELSLHGRYVRVEEFLMYRRIHAAHRTRTQSQEQAIYVPQSRGLQLRDFGVLRESLISVARAPIALPTKLRLLRTIAAWSIGERMTFYGECKELVKHALRMTRERIGGPGGARDDGTPSRP
jgi:glycosyltransferase involved in cell wall biosynthesis